MVNTYLLRNFRCRRPGGKKIFFIGFNKCGTTSFHHLLQQSGIPSIHYYYKKWSLLSHRPDRLLDISFHNLALEIDYYKTRGDLKQLLDRFTAFSDMLYISDHAFIEANGYFKLYHELFRDSYFVLNDRDMDKWIASRANHGNGSFLRRAMTYHGMSQDEVEQLWRETRERHYDEVFRHFATEGGNFLHYRIDADPIEKFARFVAPDFTINTAAWEAQNRTHG